MIKYAYDSVNNSTTNRVGEKDKMKKAYNSRRATFPVALLAMIIWFVPNVLISADNPATVRITPNPIYVCEGHTASATGTVSPADQFARVTFVMSDMGTATVTPGTATAAVTTLTVTGVKAGTTTLKGYIDGKEQTSVVVNVLRIASRTKEAAPDRTPNTRTVIGVSEIVTVYTEPSTTVSWAITGGATPTSGTGPTIDFTAPEIASTVNVTASKDGQNICSISFSVIPPTIGTFKTKASEVPSSGYLAGVWGAFMLLTDFTLSPGNVCFSRIQIAEKSGPASSISGTFANNPPFTNVAGGALWHDASGGGGQPVGQWARITVSNTTQGGTFDQVGTTPPGNPRKVMGLEITGSYTWVIPLHYKAIDSTSIEGYKYSQMEQKLTVDSTSTTEEKSGHKTTATGQKP